LLLFAGGVATLPAGGGTVSGSPIESRIAANGSVVEAVPAGAAPVLFERTTLEREEQDSLSRYAALDSLLSEFYLALEREELSVKNAEFDALIGSCRDSLLRQHVALGVFDHYRHARVMGEEAVAIHVYDEWIASGRVSTRSEFEQMEAELFAEFNRSSLIGMKAVPVTLKKPHCGTKTIPVEGKIGVLYFYDTSCAKCRLESGLVPQAMSEADFPVNFYAVYVGSDKSSWRAFRRNFKIPSKNVRLVHLWDPGMDSDYQRYYGVIGTPRLFVVLEDREIIGRRLEVSNLREIIHYLNIANEAKDQKE